MYKHAGQGRGATASGGSLWLRRKSASASLVPPSLTNPEAYFSAPSPAANNCSRNPSLRPLSFTLRNGSNRNAAIHSANCRALRAERSTRLRAWCTTRPAVLKIKNRRRWGSRPEQLCRKR